LKDDLNYYSDIAEKDYFAQKKEYQVCEYPLKFS